MIKLKLFYITFFVSLIFLFFSCKSPEVRFLYIDDEILIVPSEQQVSLKLVGECRVVAIERSLISDKLYLASAQRLGSNVLQVYPIRTLMDSGLSVKGVSWSNGAMRLNQTLVRYWHCEYIPDFLLLQVLPYLKEDLEK